MERNGASLFYLEKRLRLLRNGRFAKHQRCVHARCGGDCVSYCDRRIRLEQKLIHKAKGHTVIGFEGDVLTVACGEIANSTACGGEEIGNTTHGTAQTAGNIAGCCVNFFRCDIIIEGHLLFCEYPNTLTCADKYGTLN